MYGSENVAEEIIEGTNTDGWLSTHSVDTDRKNAESIVDIDANIEAAVVNNNILQYNLNNITTSNANDEILDMEAFEDDDSNVINNTQTENIYLKAEEPECNIVKTRTYDISICYDKYYRTPRVYLFGYDKYRSPLTTTQIMEDISSDHANKTVTIEQHPHTGITHASIHPCKHSHVMKKIIEQFKSNPKNNQTVNIKDYMIIFLKFMTSVIPTIDYDFTMR